jgi:hypothetical protein
MHTHSLGVRRRFQGFPRSTADGSVRAAGTRQQGHGRRHVAGRGVQVAGRGARGEPYAPGRRRHRVRGAQPEAAATGASQARARGDPHRPSRAKQESTERSRRKSTTVAPQRSAHAWTRRPGRPKAPRRGRGQRAERPGATPERRASMDRRDRRRTAAPKREGAGRRRLPARGNEPASRGPVSSPRGQATRRGATAHRCVHMDVLRYRPSGTIVQGPTGSPPLSPEGPTR